MVVVTKIGIQINIRIKYPILYMNNSVLSGINVASMKRNMEEGQFSLMRRVYRNTSQPKKVDSTSSTMNLTYKDSSSRTERLKSLAIGKEEYNSTVSYRSYDTNGVTHTLRRVRQAGSVAPKKKGLNV
jgi:hypothetical protein